VKRVHKKDPDSKATFVGSGNSRSKINIYKKCVKKNEKREMLRQLALKEEYPRLGASA
jgi:hypothetical protein